MTDRWVCLSRKHDIWTVIDEELWPFISRWNWNYARSGTSPQKVYAKRNEGKARTPVLMHRAILFHVNPLPTCMQGRNGNGRQKFVCDHEDGDSLNNRLSNLRWLTKAEDIVNSWNNRFNSEGQLLKASLREQALQQLGLDVSMFLPENNDNQLILPEHTYAKSVLGPG